MLDLLEPYNKQLMEEGRNPIQPYLHESIQELIVVPSAPSICSNIEGIKSLPLVLITSHLFTLRF